MQRNIVNGISALYCQILYRDTQKVNSIQKVSQFITVVKAQTITDNLWEFELDEVIYEQ